MNFTPLPNPVNTFRPSVFSALHVNDLRDNAKLNAWIDAAAREPRALITGTHQDRVNICSAAERALEVGKSPVALFAHIVSKRRWELISNAQEDRAVDRIRALNSSTEWSDKELGEMSRKFCEQFKLREEIEL